MIDSIYKCIYNVSMKFEWDERKNRENIKKHGLDFSDAPEVFQGPILASLDTRFDYGEERWIGLGLFRGLLVVAIVFVDKENGNIRIISFRKADSYERQKFEKEVRNGFGTS